MSLCCTVGYKWVTVMDGVKFESKNVSFKFYDHSKLINYTQSVYINILK